MNQLEEAGTEQSNLWLTMQIRTDSEKLSGVVAITEMEERNMYREKLAIRKQIKSNIHSFTERKNIQTF